MGCCKCSRECMIGWFKDNALLLLTLVGVIVGFVLAVAIKVYTEYDLLESTSTNNVTNKTEIDVVVLSKSVSHSSGTNYLGILIFSMAFGMAMSVEPEHTNVMLQFFNAMKTIIFKILTVVLWTLPIATTSLIAGALLKIDDLLGVMVSLGVFSATVIAGLFIHTFCTIPLVYFIWTRRNPYVILFKSARSSIVVVVIRSSIGAMPEIFKSCERIGMHEKIYDFVVPLAINFKKDGSTVFITCSCIWLAQTEGITLDAGQIVTIAIMTAALSLCLPGIPSTSLVAIATIASSAGIPYNNIGVLIAMEWLLDAIRSGVNGASHVINTAIVDAKMAPEMRLVETVIQKRRKANEMDDAKNLAVATENTTL
uniref:Amino acid transporter n=1 Tax=Saccoglossus kowalevskii TaxID=10224 RepID=A0ABM0MY60_SACKO|nr:PREDICTED: excitatory amino acid transporter 2-like [Saccoglossus kowalevskii]